MRRGVLRWALGCLIAAAFVHPVAAAPNAPSDYALLYWVDDADFNSSLYRWDADTGSTLIAENVGQIASGEIIGGNWLYFDMLNSEGYFNVFRIRVDGGPAEAIPVTEGLDLLRAISADGRWLYVSTNQDDCWTAYRVSIASLPAQVSFEPLVDTEDCMSVGALSPDGQWLLGYLQADDLLVTIPVDGGSYQPVIAFSNPDTGFTVENAGWAPDGTLLFIGYSQQETTSAQAVAIYRIQPNGTGIEEIGSAPPECSLAGGGAAYWSPDGVWMACSALIGDRVSVFVRAIRGGATTSLYDGVSGYFLGWRPDSAAVVIFGGDSDLRVLALDGTPIITLSGELEYSPRMGAWLPLP